MGPFDWITPEAETLIKHFESCRLSSYVIKGESWATIGWGTVIPLPQHPTKITQREADLRLRAAMLVRAEFLFKNIPIKIQEKYTQAQKGAILSFAYNAVPARFKTSGAFKHIQEGNVLEASKRMSLWINGSNPSVRGGLIRRRKCELYILNGGNIEELKRLKFFQ